MIRDFLVSWKIFVCETLNLTRESQNRVVNSNPGDWFQAFVNYNFCIWYFVHAKPFLGARPYTWEIVHVKKQTCTLLIVERWKGLSCVQLLSFRLYYFSLHDDYPPFLYIMRTIYIAALPGLDNYHKIAVRDYVSLPKLGQIRKSIYQVSYLWPSVFSNNFF